MIGLDITKHRKVDNYRLLTGSIVPRPIAFVTSLSKNNVLKGAPFSYFNVVSSDLALISVSVERTMGKHKHTSENIIRQKEFVIHVVDQNNVEKINKTSASLPANESEIDYAHLTCVPSQKLTVPGIKEAKIRLECVLKQVINLSDSNRGCDLIIGEVVYMHIDEAVYVEGSINIDALAPVSRLDGANYATIGDKFTIERPK